MQVVSDSRGTGRKRTVKILVFHVLIIALIGLYVFALDYFSIGCPIRFLLGIPCPTCGVTRALLSLVRLDFTAYLRYNPMAVPLCIVIFMAFHENLLRISHKWYQIIFIGMSMLTFVVYLVRLWHNIVL